MAIQKYGQNEPAEVFRGREAAVVNDHMQRVGKAVSEFDENELDSLNNDLESVRESTESPSAQPQEPELKATDKDDTSSAKAGSTKKVKDNEGE